jgi:hypothetical protein
MRRNMTPNTQQEQELNISLVVRNKEKNFDCYVV